MKEESVGTVVKYEGEHGITIKALRRYADDLVEMGVSRDQVGHVIEETAKHGTPASSLVQGLGMFLESAENPKKEITLTVNVNGELKTIKIVIKNGNERGGLIHWWLRHVVGYEMEKKPVTDFWPMGQRIVVEGEAKQLPNVIKSPDELAEILEKSIQEIAKNPEEYFINQRTGNLRRAFNDIVKTSDLKGVPIEGIDSIKVAFSFKEETIDNKVIYTYSLESFYPVEGSSVWEYRSALKEWVVKG